MSSSSNSIYAAIEAGGTSFLLAIMEGPLKVLEKQRIPTTTPEETLSACTTWLKERKFSAIGIACFGPLDLCKESKTYGYLTSTPKPGWSNVDVVGHFKKAFDCPIGFDTDVNAAALGQVAYGFSEEQKKTGMDSCCYVTVGTGIGVGVVINGQPLHGLLHPEIGHIRSPIEEGDQFKGNCPFHGACIEGMVAAGAIAERKQIKPSALEQLSDDDNVWKTMGYYLAHLCSTLVLALSPHKIVFGGGLPVNRPFVLKYIRSNVVQILNGYVQSSQITENIDDYIILSPFEGNAGIIGAAELARLSLSQH